MACGTVHNTLHFCFVPNRTEIFCAFCNNADTYPSERILPKRTDLCKNTQGFGFYGQHAIHQNDPQLCKWRGREGHAMSIIIKSASSASLCYKSVATRARAIICSPRGWEGCSSLILELFSSIGSPRPLPQEVASHLGRTVGRGGKYFPRTAKGARS